MRHALHAALLELLAGADRPLTGRALSEMLRERGDPCPSSLVFRTLAQLQAAGAVHKVLLARGYVLAGNAGIWLSCSCCGVSRFLPDQALEPPLMDLADAVGFRSGSVHVEMAGRCPQCADAIPT